MYVVESDYREVIGSGVHFHDKAVGCNGDNLANCPLAVIVAHASSSSGGRTIV
jgi:hypothetical protein